MNKTSTARQALGVLGADASTADVINYCEDILKVSLSADTVRAARKAVAEAVQEANPEQSSYDGGDDEDVDTDPTEPERVYYDEDKGEDVDTEAGDPDPEPAAKPKFVFEEKTGETKDDRRKRYAREYCAFRYANDPEYASKRKTQSGISHKKSREAKKATASAE